VRGREGVRGVSEREMERKVEGGLRTAYKSIPEIHQSVLQLPHLLLLEHSSRLHQFQTQTHFLHQTHHCIFCGTTPYHWGKKKEGRTKGNERKNGGGGNRYCQYW
jgi:hypothetical protein